MSLRADLLRTMLVQGAGAASVLLAVFWLGATFGPQVQGRFSRTKAEIEFLAALVAFGLPQAMFFFARLGRLELARARALALGAGALGVGVALGYALWIAAAPAQAGAALMFALAVGCGAWYGPLRALLLTRATSGWFNAITALPQVGMLLLALAWGLAQGGDAALALGFGLAYLLPALVAARVLGAGGLAVATATAATAAAPVSAAELLRYGAAAGLAGALASAAIVIAQRAVESTLGAVALGVFAMALSISQVPLMPVSFVTPLLFRQWVGRAGAALPLAPLVGVVASIGLVAAAAALLATVWPDFGFDPLYAPLGAVLPAMLVASAGEALSRLLATRANATGRPWQVVFAEVLRTLWLLGAWLAGALGQGLAAWAWHWAIAAWLVALALVPAARASAARDADVDARARP